MKLIISETTQTECHFLAELGLTSSTVSDVSSVLCSLPVEM